MHPGTPEGNNVTHFSNESTPIPNNSGIIIPQIDQIASLSTNWSHSKELIKHLHAVRRSQDSLLLAVYDSQTEQPIVLGHATKSTHEYRHWGIHFPILANSEQGFEGARNIIDKLIQHIETEHLRQEPVTEKGRQIIALGTVHPEVFSGHQFQTVFEHPTKNGENFSWMYRITGCNHEFFPVDFAKPTVHAAMHESVRPVIEDRHIKQAGEIIRAEWGEETELEFYTEYHVIKNMPGSEWYGVFEGDNLIGVGAIVKALHGEQTWSRSWIVVDLDQRGKGHALRLIQGMLAHADKVHENLPDSIMIMEGFTYIPDYYRKFGNTPVARVTDPDPRGYPTWTIRITPSISDKIIDNYITH